MRILFLGDIFGRPGREAVKRVLPTLRRKYKPDVIFANIENIAHGAGVTRDKAEEMLSLGIDACTLGDHAFDAQAPDELFAGNNLPLLRPENWPGDLPGRGWMIIEKECKRILLMNVLGRVFMKVHAGDPFECIESILTVAQQESFDVSVLDLHAEATSEKRAIAEVFDGTIDLIMGTHTHVQTNDATTLPKGTGFLSDVGMCGPSHSVIGIDPVVAIRKFREALPLCNKVAEGPCDVCGCVAEVSRGKTTVIPIRLEGIPRVS